MQKLFNGVIFALLAVAVLVFVKQTFADSANLVSENFENPIQYRQPGVPSSYPWWAIVDENSLQHYGAPCDPKNISCLVRMSESGDYFARFTISPDANPPSPMGYNNVEFSQTQTGYTFNQGAICPTVGHPVTMTESMRFGPNYKADGTGGAIGSAGGGMWNSYPDFINQTLHPITAFWWSWGQQGQYNGLIDGLTVNVFNQNNPVFFQRVTAPISLQDWMTWTTTWGKLDNGNDTVQFSVKQNGKSYDLGTATTSSLGCLSFTHWNDNQLVTFDQFGNLTVSHLNAVTPDYWDLGPFTIKQQ